jgi:hypothetical protein
MILEVLLILPLYLGIFLIIFRFRPIIKAMADFNEFLDCVDTPKEAMDQSRKREHLRGLIERGEAQKLGGKTPWTIDRLDKASDKVIDKLYAALDKQPVAPNAPPKDILSHMAGVKNFDSMMKDINGNFLIKNSASEMVGNITNKVGFSGNSPMEVLGSHVYEKCGFYLAPVSLFCTVFNHLDWGSFAAIAEKRAAEKQVAKDVDEGISLTE